MNKSVVASVVASCLVAGVALGGPISWYNVTDMNKPGGGLVPASEGWLAELRSSVDNSVLSSTTTWDDNGVMGLTVYNAPDAVSVYSRVWAGPSAGAATHYADGSVVAFPSSPTPQTYDVPGNPTWVAVPEPASMALFGLGLLTVAARRRMKK